MTYVYITVEAQAKIGVVRDLAELIMMPIPVEVTVLTYRSEQKEKPGLFIVPKLTDNTKSCTLFR
jgi:hypothetical protein